MLVPPAAAFFGSPFAAYFLTGARLAGAFLTGAFFAGTLFTRPFLAGLFLIAFFFTAILLDALFFATAFLPPAFLAVALFPDVLFVIPLAMVEPQHGESVVVVRRPSARETSAAEEVRKEVGNTCEQTLAGRETRHTLLRPGSQAIKVKYFADTDTLCIETRNHDIIETMNLDENTVLDLDAAGQICAITFEHASQRQPII